MLGPVVALVAAGSYPRPPIARTPSTAPNNTRARATNAATAPRTGGRRCSDNLAPFSSAPGRTSLASAVRPGCHPPCWTCHCREPRAEDPHSLTQPMRSDGGGQETRDSADQRRSEEHTSELQSLRHLVCRLLLEKKER